MKFRKKPVVVEAVQFFKREHTWPDGVCTRPCDCKTLDGRNNPHIHTLEGIHYVNDSDWVITGVEGEKYPCKDSIFRATYEPAEENDKCAQAKPSKDASGTACKGNVGGE